MTPDEALRHEWLKSSSTSSSGATTTVPAAPQPQYRVYRAGKPVAATGKPAHSDRDRDRDHSHSLDDSGTFLPPIL
jgi:hypothetical protein